MTSASISSSAYDRNVESPNHNTFRMAPTTYLDHPYGYFKRNKASTAALVASVASTISTFPLDSVKSRLQAYPTSYTGFRHCVQLTWREEKLPGFFRGLLVPLATISFVRTLSFSVYSTTKHSLNGFMDTAYGVNPVAHSYQKGTLPTWYTATCFGIAGGAAGFAASVAACPLELAKLTNQLSGKLLADSKNQSDPRKKALGASYAGKGPLATLVTIFRQKGPAALYTGFQLHLLRDTLGTSIYFASYESAKQVLGTTFGVNPTNNLSVYSAGGISGIVSWALIYPLDRAKSEHQKNSLSVPRGVTPPPRPMISWFKRGQYRGLAVSMARTCVVNMLFFGLYENTKKLIDRLPDGTTSL